MKVTVRKDSIPGVSFNADRGYIRVLACTFRCIALECRSAVKWSDAKNPGGSAARI